jgi:hypothetical protein
MKHPRIIALIAVPVAGLVTAGLLFAASSSTGAAGKNAGATTIHPAVAVCDLLSAAQKQTLDRAAAGATITEQSFTVRTKTSVTKICQWSAGGHATTALNIETGTSAWPDFQMYRARARVLDTHPLMFEQMSAGASAAAYTNNTFVLLGSNLTTPNPLVSPMQAILKRI